MQNDSTDDDIGTPEKTKEGGMTNEEGRKLEEKFFQCPKM